MSGKEIRGYHPGLEGKSPEASWALQLPWLKRMQDAHRFEQHDGPVIHRNDLFTHVRRTAFIVDHLGYYLATQGYQPAQEANRLSIFRKAYHHDDPELITTDISTPVKLAMSSEEKALLKKQEREAIRAIAAKHIYFPSEFSRDDYIEEMDELLDKQTYDARLVDVADKLDGLGEALHELRCGNTSFHQVLGVYREGVFPKFEEYEFWKLLKNDPAIQLGLFPTDEDVSHMPILEQENLRSREELPVDTLGVEGLPRWYRSWTSITLNHFDINPEKFLFPGWYLDLWKRWGIHGQTSHSGVWIS